MNQLAHRAQPWRCCCLAATQAHCILGRVRGVGVQRPACCARCVGGRPQGGWGPRGCLGTLCGQAWVLMNSCWWVGEPVVVRMPRQPRHSPESHRTAQAATARQHPPSCPTSVLVAVRGLRGATRMPGPPTSISSGGAATCAKRARCTSAATRELGRVEHAAARGCMWTSWLAQRT